MRLILILIAMTIALPISISQAAQLLSTPEEKTSVEAKTIKTSSAKAMNNLLRADANPWLSSRMQGLSVSESDGGHAGKIGSLIMNGTKVTAVKLVRPDRGTIFLPYDLFKRDYTGVEPELELAVSLERAMDEEALEPLNRLGSKIIARQPLPPAS